MKGIIFNIVESVVIAEHGIDTWDDVIDDSGVLGAYTSLGSYPDSDLLAIADTVADRINATPSAVIRHVGHQGISRVYDRHPEFFTDHDDVLSFLLSIETVVHPEVRSLYPGADVPHFVYNLVDESTLELVYRSTRQRCDFAEGLILGAAEHYRQSVEIVQTTCMLRGDDQCTLRVSTT
jgi:predicted hydrocarbon binding protein